MVTKEQVQMVTADVTAEIAYVSIEQTPPRQTVVEKIIADSDGGVGPLVMLLDALAKITTDAAAEAATTSPELPESVQTLFILVRRMQKMGARFMAGFLSGLQFSASEGDRSLQIMLSNAISTLASAEIQGINVVSAFTDSLIARGAASVDDEPEATTGL